MPLRFLKLTTVLFFLSSFPIFGLTGNPSCQINGNLKRVHVWYTINNKDNKYNWFLQISRVYENNIIFVDESCNPVDLNQKIEIPINTTRKFGMIVTEAKSFNSIYSFTGVRNDEELIKVPNRKKTCIFVVAPYGPGQMDRVDWKLNNADCFSDNFGTEINFK